MALTQIDLDAMPAGRLCAANDGMSEPPKPTWGPIWLACKACGHWWDDWQPCGVPIDTWVAHVGTYHCPICGKGSRSVLVRRRPMSEKPA